MYDFPLKSVLLWTCQSGCLNNYLPLACSFKNNIAEHEHIKKGFLRYPFFSRLKIFVVLMIN